MILKRKYKIIFVFFGIMAPVAICVGLLNWRHTTTEPLNVVLITIDALRPDHLGCYGYKRNTTANIDRFAGEGTVFSQAISQGSWTGVSLACLITANYPYTTGIADWDHGLNPDLPTLPLLLKKRGYSTCLINGHRLSRKLIEMGLREGIDTYNNNEGELRADEVTERAIKFLSGNKDKKFFLWLHYFDPHAPYAPPAPYNRIFADKLKADKTLVKLPRDMPYAYWVVPGYLPKDNTIDADYFISQYDGEIRFTDEQMGLLLSKIEELGLDKKTIVVITADHGELLVEHGMLFRHGMLYDEVLKVPLLIRCKGLIPASRIITQQVQSIDIIPTILAFLRMPKDRHMRGSSLLPVIFGKGLSPSLYAFSSELPYERNNFLMECIRTDSWKLIYKKRGSQELYELYNLKLDPQESKNLINTEKDKFRFLKKRLDNWRKITPVVKTKAYLLRGETKEALRSLGYLY